jgi:formiminotetrahydrofolate cyclodeaminase
MTRTESERWDSFAKRLASLEPTPGGGAAAARTGHHVAALVTKVVRLSLRRSKSEALTGQLESLEKDACDTGQRFRDLEQADEDAFRAFLGAMRPASRQGDPETDQALRVASRSAATVPLEIMELAVKLLSRVQELCVLAVEGKVRAESDVGVAAELLVGAYDSCVWTVRVNLPYLRDPSDRTEIEVRWQAAEVQLRALHAKIRELLNQRMG